MAIQFLGAAAAGMAAGVAGASLLRADQYQEKREMSSFDEEREEESEEASWEEFNENEESDEDEEDPWAPSKFDEE